MLGEGPEAAEAVAAYLQRHREFLIERPEVLAELALPPASGAAVSLIEHQVAALRKRHRRLEKKHRELLEIARQNDALHGRFHRLVPGLLRAPGIEALLATLRDALITDFRADFVAVRLFAARRFYAGIGVDFLARLAELASQMIDPRVAD